MTLLQFLRLRCRHRNRSRPVGEHQECLDCGADLLVDYSISAEDKAQARSVEHYETRDRSVQRVRTPLRFKKRA